MNTHEVNNNAGDGEQLPADEQKVREMLGGLRRVEAPRNFEFGVKARIARRQESGTRATRLPRLLAYGTPLAAVAVLGGAVAFISFDRVPDTAQTAQAPAVENFAPVQTPEREVVAEVPEPTEAAPIVPARSAPVAAESRSGSRAVRTSTADIKLPAPRSARPSGGGSYDSAIESTTPIMPPGFSADAGPGEIVKTPGGTGVSVSLILSQLGIEAESKDGVWRAVSVRENSIAAKSGVLAGDLIDAVGDRDIRKVESVDGRVTATRLSVTRAGKAVQVELRP